MVELAAQGGLEPVVLIYMNRLSDFLFVAARRAVRLYDTRWILCACDRTQRRLASRLELSSGR